MRHTPAGVAALEFRLSHRSEQPEAGTSRKVEAEIGAIAFETQARLIAGRPLGSSLAVTTLAITAAPMEPPIVRMFAFMPLATPVWSAGTAATIRFARQAKTSPIPAPITALAR